MPRYLILAQSRVAACALEAWCEALGLKEQFGAAVVAESIVVGDTPVRVEGGFGNLPALCQRLEEAAGLNEGRAYNPIVVLVDSVRPALLDPLDPMAERFSWDRLLAQLILSFPEFRWIFGLIEQVGDDLPEREHGLASLATQQSGESLFDGQGLRELVRGKARERLRKERLSAYLPQRRKLALAIDDEPSYASFNAYAAYRFGYRALVASSEDELLRLLGGSSQASCELTLTLEDLYLNFPDRQAGRLDGAKHWSSLEERDAALPRLSELRPLRIFVSTDHSKGTRRGRRARNAAVRRRLAQAGQLGRVVRKPLAGLFDLWNRSGISRQLGGKAGRPGLAEGFEWPPRLALEQEEGLGDHSSPGRLLSIAGCLLARAGKLHASGVRTVPEAVYGAVLATEALELLGGRTPTTSLEALSLRHEFEALAECRFLGVGAHFDVQSRMTDLKAEIEALSVYFGRENRKLSAWNAEASILGHVIQTFREHDQFDEELKLQIRSRTLHRRMWFKSQKWWGPFGDQLRWINPAYWVVRYVHFLIDSVPKSIACIALWVLLLAALHSHHFTPTQSFAAHLAAATEAFFSPTSFEIPEGATPSDLQVLATTSIAVVGGILHFGILLSHLYSLLVRK